MDNSRVKVVDILSLHGSLLVVGHVVGDHHLYELRQLHLLSTAIQLRVHLVLYSTTFNVRVITVNYVSTVYSTNYVSTVYSVLCDVIKDMLHY